MNDQILSDTPTETTATAPAKIKMKFNLICASKCKRFALEFAKANRAQAFTRVSEDFLVSCEVALKSHIMSRVKSHPSKGKTLM